jgi:hypothetical protein
MNPPEFHNLDQALASLPRSVAPPHDLWPQIARATGQLPAARQTPRWPLALAASLAMVSLVGALCWSVWRSAQPGGGAGSNVANFEPPQNAAYVAARAALVRTFEERLDLLAPATRQRVQADLALIRKANADIRAALAQDPASPLLLQLLRSTWQQEIDLYTNVSRTTEPLMSRRSRT